MADATGGKTLLERPAHPARLVTGAQPTLTERAVEREESTRLNAIALTMLVLCVAGGLAAPLFGGDPTARRWFQVSSIWLALVLVALYVVTRRPDRAQRWKIWTLAHLVPLGTVGMLNYFGILSPATILVAVALLLVGQLDSRRAGWSLLTMTCVMHTTLAGLLVTGALPDRAIVGVRIASTGEQLAGSVAVLAVYVALFVLGKLSRARTVKAFENLELALREVAARDAQLVEARQELAHALQLGGPGRFTDLTLGSYRLGAVLGRGGMGEVYEALHVDSREPAAVKVMQTAALAEPDAHSRFVREATITAAMTSPHVVRVFEVAPEDARIPYIAMERLHGEDLAERLKQRQRLPLAETIELVRQIELGLAAAHGAGVVHRDLKPHNLFVEGGPAARAHWKILDFGVSKLVTGNATLTQGALVGTPAYMAPEQAAGRVLDHRADLFALGAIAYRCLTGRQTITVEGPAAALYRLMSAMPDRPGALAELPADVDAVLAIALAKRPRDRFQAAGELSQALVTAARGELSEALRGRARRLEQEWPWGAESAADPFDDD